MKKISLLLLAVLPLLFVACSDEDEKILPEDREVRFVVSAEKGEGLSLHCYSSGRITIDWGDGEKTEHATIPSQDSVSHTYSEKKTYNVKIESDNDHIRSLSIYGENINSIPSLGIGKPLKVDFLELRSINKISFLDLGGLSKLKVLFLSNLRDLRYIENINKCSLLLQVSLSEMPNLTNLDLSENKQLSAVDCYSLGLTKLNLGELENLEQLAIYNLST